MEQTGLTKDLNRSEEVVLVAIALNPDKKGKQMIGKLDTSEKVFSHCVNTLLSRKYIELNDEGNCWKVTELGELALNKFRVMIKFDLIYAKKTNEDQSIINNMIKKKKRLDAAYEAVKSRH